MIDEKKIEHEAICYTTDGYGQSCNNETLELIEESFKSGVDWAIQEFLKDLWHPDSDKPVMSEHGMILVELNDITAYKYSLWRSTTTYECLCNNKGYIRRWLYVDELFPKEGGEK